MSLRNDFHVAQTHMAVSHAITQFTHFARQMMATPAIKSAFETAPQAVIGGRNFLQIALDDAMDAFVSVMTATIENSNVKFEDIPHEFYHKLMKDRHGPKVTAKEAKDALREAIDDKLSMPAALRNERLPAFLQVIMHEADPPALANIANSWLNVIENMQLLMLDDAALAAKRVSVELKMAAASKIQGVIDQRQKNAGVMGGKGGGAGKTGNTFEAIVEKLEGMDLPEEVKTKVAEEIDNYNSTQGQGPEASKIKQYLKWVADLPWGKFSELEDDLNKTQSILDEDHYGLERVKEAVVEHVGVEAHTGGNSGRILCLVGPPGVGKTSIGKSIAKATGRSYARMALGGVRDEATIRGHSRTYVGSRPGRVIETMKTAGTNNPMIILDEIDKMGGQSVNGDPTAAMLEVLDPGQNDSFHDNFMEIDYDLSKVMFIATANDLYSIPGPLRDRMDIIQIPGYTREEKLEIAKRHLVKKRMAANGLTDAEIEIKDSAIRELINGYTREAGVRSLDRILDKVCRKAVIMRKKDDSVGKVVVDDKTLEDILGASKIKRMDVKAKGDRVGVVNGLAYSTVGGSIMQIGAQLRPSRADNHDKRDFVLKVTGNLGKTMDESTEYALTSALEHIMDKIGTMPNGLKGYEIHVAPLEGAVPKDGPSAGAAITLALVSLMTNIPIKCNVAMTGAISQYGEVMPIGGLPEKMDGALQDGADTVLVPRANEGDLDDVPESVKSKLNIIIVDTIEDVLEHALSAPLSTAKMTAKNQGGASDNFNARSGGQPPANDDTPQDTASHEETRKLSPWAQGPSRLKL